MTVIEVGLIVTLMVSGDKDTDTLARDTVFAAVMITCNGIIGLSILLGALREGTAPFNAEGSATAFATVATLATLCLVLPTFTTSATSDRSSRPRSCVRGGRVPRPLCALPRRPDIPAPRLLPPARGHSHGGRARRAALAGRGAAEPGATARRAGGCRRAGQDLLARYRERGRGDRRSHSAVGVAIAVLVLAPESLAAARNARRARVQVSFSLAYGSAMASIGLTIPRSRRRIDLARGTAHARARLDPDRPARAHGGGERAHAVARPGDAPGGWRAPGDPGCVLFLAVQP